jgi:acetylornithine deacetylase
VGKKRRVIRKKGTISGQETPRTKKLNMENAIHILTAEAVELLKDMIAIPSPSFSEDEVCTHISNWMKDNGIMHKRAGNNLIARLSEQPSIDSALFNGKPTLMLCAHIDTVSPSNEYSFDPYKPDYSKASEVIGSDQIVAGLGSNDDGASVVSMIAAFRYFTGIGGDSTVFNTISTNAAADILLVLSCEEERSGLNGMTGLWPEIKAGVDYAIVGEPTCMQAATAERGLLVIDATAHGVSGHAARNEGVNAIDVALQDILNLKNHEFTKISPRMGKVNLNVTQINAGTAHNVIPDTCTFVIDIRPTEQYTNEEILNELHSICKSELKARNLSNCSSATHESSPLQSVAEKLGIGTFSSPTTSDWMRIDCDAIKMGPGNSSRSHKKDEFVYINEIEDGIRTYIEFINNL